ncbi:hypothetical protein ACE3MS_13365 [Paenibacillus dendritiformis]|uniref:hypothetical protein n=1 Tax=Paenibacillus dendritiformis TaxID=130049 RepID=UPI00365079EC
MPSALLVIASIIGFTFALSLPRGNTSFSIFLLLAACTVGLYALFIYIDNKRGAKMNAWLLSNSALIRQDGAHYNGILIDSQTQFMQYEICFSWIIVSYRTKSSYYVSGYHPTPLLNLLFCSFICVFGWCSFPFGPVYALHSLGSNILARPKPLNTVLQELREYRG